jgi:PAS domain S-box-containing protein
MTFLLDWTAVKNHLTNKLVLPIQNFRTGTVQHPGETVSSELEDYSELDEQQAHHESLLHSVPGVVYRCDYDENWPMQFLSDGFNQLTGYDPIDFINDDDRTFGDLIHPDDRERVTETVTGAVEAEEPFEVEFRIIDCNEEIRWVLERGEAVRQDGRVENLQGVILDVTERHQIKEPLTRSEERFRQCVENIDEVFWLTDAQKNELYYISPAFEEIWGRPVDELYDDLEVFMDVIDERDRERVQEQLPQQKEGDYDVEYRIQRPDGEMRWIHDQAFPVYNDDGEVYRIAGIAKDITQRKRMKQELSQAEKLANLGEMAASMMHEINNPNGFIDGNSRVLKEKLASLRDRLKDGRVSDQELLDEFDELEEIVDSIQKGSSRIDNLVEKVEVFASDHEGSETDVVERNIVEIAQRSVEEIKATKPETVDLELDVDDQLRGSVCLMESMRGEMQQVLVNLLRNAVQAVDDTSGRVQLFLRRNDDAVEIRVRDNGDGIPPEQQSEIFNPFYSTKPIASGTGLGLSIVKGIVDRLNGTIDVESNVGDYTVFRLEIPCSMKSDNSEVDE